MSDLGRRYVIYLRSQREFQILDTLLRLETIEPQRPNLGHISHFLPLVKFMGGTGEMSE